ncbi:MAG TPA: amidohydrolase family protein, partial [bacterium]|nr:amidohydrolase family protein [bacterium]
MAARPEIPILDFHAHFPVREARDAAREEYVARFGEAKWERVMSWLHDDQRNWRRAWGFPDPEPPGSDEEMAERWAAEVDRHQLVRVVFTTGGDNDRLARVVARHPGRFVGFAHHDPFRTDAPAELERAVRALGLRGYKL